MGGDCAAGWLFGDLRLSGMIYGYAGAQPVPALLEFENPVLAIFLRRRVEGMPQRKMVVS